MAAKSDGRVLVSTESRDSTSDAARWGLIEELFHAARLVDPGEVEAWLEGECGGDEELQREVLSLLSFGEDAQTRVAGAVADALFAEGNGGDGLEGGMPHDAKAPVAGDRIGPYRLLRVLGRGGLSTVFLAERDDQQFKMQVAIKVIRRELDSDELRERLRRERQILADFNHPNIARLLDGGTTDDDQPYFVLEFIDGEDLESYCDHRRLSVADRLALFTKVCSAVEYAHRNLIIHRDIKPANVLVTPDGIPKLLDFGIAKSLQASLSAELLASTAPDLRLLTPQFASPEQVRGEKLTTATDIYSLGVVLFRLLTGRHPYQLEGVRASQIERVICEVVPEKASVAIDRSAEKPQEELARTGTSQHKLRRALAGDLDTIVSKALRKESERRYASVQLLRDDIHRHLVGLPVIARPDTLSYRVSKFLRRHVLVAATAAGIAMLTLLYTFQLAHERNKARREAVKAEQISKMMSGLFQVSGANEAKGETVTARELLERGAERIGVELRDQPEVQAMMMEVMGDAYRSLGLFRRALPLYEEALRSRRQVLGASHPDVASSLNRLGELSVDLIDYDSAGDYFDRAFELRSSSLGPRHRETLTTLNNLAAVAALQGDLEEAEARFRRVLEMRRETLGAEHSEVATSLNNLGDVLARAGDLQAAETHYRQALALKKRLRGPLHADVAVTINNLASLMQANGDPEEARGLYREALEINRKILDRGHPDIIFGLRRLASLEKNRGDAAAALVLLDDALGIAEAAQPPDEGAVASVLESRAECFLLGQQAGPAERSLRRAVEIRRRQYPEGHWRRSHVEGLLGAALLAAGRPEQARPLLEAAVRNLAASLGEQHKRTRLAARRLEALRESAGEESAGADGSGEPTLNRTAAKSPESEDPRTPL